jgi:ribonuclease HII
MNACRENELWDKYSVLLGIDEAGRGPWAGPISAAAVVFPSNFLGLPEEFINTLNDSKQLSEKKREMLFSQIKKYSLAYSISYFDNDFIDKNGIGVANKLIVEKLYKNIKRKIKNIDLVLLDYIGGFRTKSFKLIIINPSYYIVV